MKELKDGALFGHEEILLGIKRRTRVRTLSTCNIIYLNKKEFLDIFPKKEL